MGNLRANEQSGNDHKLAGSIYEHKFVVDAMLRGLYPHTPPADMPCHDFVVLNNDGRTYITQVRSTSHMQPRAAKETSLRFKVSSRCHAKQTVLSESVVNVLSVYIIPYDTWYHIPAKELTATCVNLMPHIIGSKGKWEKYKGAWEVFERKL